MVRRKVVYAIVLAAIATAGLVATTPGANARVGGGRPLEITGTARGSELVRTSSQRFADQGFPVEPGHLHAWELASGDVIVAEALPRNLRLTSETDPTGRTHIEVSYDIGAQVEADLERIASLDGAVAATPSWAQIGGSCLEIVSNPWGWLQPCYKLRKLVNESFSRDYYSLEQFGTVQAAPFTLGKIYDGWVAAVKAPGSASMAWEDWDPLGDLTSNNCMVQPLQISVMGTGLSTGGLLCERWDMTLYQDPGHFKQLWSCGCVWPFGQPYPNSRGMKYVQGISVPGGGSVFWTLSAGLTAF
jgi:hypothetical protein